MGSNEKIVYFSDLGEFKDVLEFSSYDSFPETGETGRIYVAKDDNRIYRWSDDSDGYVEISASADAPVTSVNGQDGDVVLTAGDIDYDDGGSGEDTVKDVLDDTYRKDEVNALVQSNSAHYRGFYATWSDIPSDASLYPEDDDGNRVPGPNDYIAVGDMSDYPSEGDSSDSSSPEGDEYFGAWRMTYSGLWDDHGKNGWQPAFQYNESPFSPQQQAALDSTITKDKVDKLDALPDADTLAGDFAAKQDKLSNAQVSAIDSVVDERKTVVTYTDETTLEFDIEGELTSSSITNIYDATTVIIGTAVTSIGDYAFEGCSGLTNITIGDNVTSIGYAAFYNCRGLVSVTIPDSVTNIGDESFRICTRLTSVTIGNGVTSIGNYAFSYCTGLTSVTIGNGVTSIGYSAFGDCSNLTNVTVPNSVTSIGPSAFANCSGLTSVTIPDSVTNIEGYAFSYCTGLTSVTFVGRTLTEVKAMSNYPWDISQTSIITTWNDASKEWVENQIPIVPSASATAPVMDGAANAGSSGAWARGDHRHPTDTSRAAAADLRYRIAEVELTAKLPTGVTLVEDSVTVDYNFYVYSDRIFISPSGIEKEIFQWDLDGTNGCNGADYGYGNFALMQNGASIQPSEVVLTVCHALADRTVNLITAQSGTASIDIELPELANVGRMRDFYVRLTVSETSAATWTIGQGESWDAMGSPPSSFAAGTYLYHISEVAAGVWHCEDLFGVLNRIPMYQVVGVTPSGGTLTVSPYTVSTYTAGDSAAAFTVAVGTGASGVARDCELVIDCTATGAVAPTVTWPATFHPRTDAATDFACEAGKRNVYFISEYATGNFAVGGWQETAGGNAS